MVHTVGLAHDVALREVRIPHEARPSAYVEQGCSVDDINRMFSYGQVRVILTAQACKKHRRGGKIISRRSLWESLPKGVPDIW